MNLGQWLDLPIEPVSNSPWVGVSRRKKHIMSDVFKALNFIFKLFLMHSYKSCVILLVKIILKTIEKLLNCHPHQLFGLLFFWSCGQKQKNCFFMKTNFATVMLHEVCVGKSIWVESNADKIPLFFLCSLYRR